MSQKRLQPVDDFVTILIKMSEGNPGVITVLTQLLVQTAVIDPDDAFGGLGPILALDFYSIYGSHIWVLYKDICAENIMYMIAVLRAVQLGFLNRDILRNLDKTMINVEDLYLQVKHYLPNFDKNQV